MAKIRIKNIGTQLLVSIDNKTVTVRDKDNIKFSIDNYIVTMEDGEEEVFKETTENIIEPQEKSPVDLMLLLNTMLTTDVVSSGIENVIVVAKSGGDYTSIKSASDVSEAGDVIIVYAGVYNENPIALKDVTLMSHGEVIVNAIDINTNLITMSNGSSIQRITLKGVTNAACIYVGGTAFLTNIENCDFDTSSIAIEVDGVGKFSTIEECKFGNNIVTALFADNGALINASNILSYATNSVKIDNGSSGFVHNIGIVGGVNGLYVDNASSLIFSVLTSSGTQNTIRANNASEIIGNSLTSTGGTSKDIWQEDTASLLRITGAMLNPDTFDVASFNNIDIEYNGNKEGDEGYHITGELTVGQAEKGGESVFGEGDSYTRGLLVYTETELGVQANVSAEASSPSGSTISLPGVIADNSIYISSERYSEDYSDYVKFYGYKVTIDGSLFGSGEIVHEYWNGAAWTEFSVMATDSSGQYFPHAQDVYGNTTTKQVRFNQQIDDDWTKNDPISSGTNLYWVRIRVKTAITTSMLIEQIKVHTNRSEINKDGWIEYFGKARPLGSFSWDLGLVEPANSSPSDGDVYLGDNLSVGRKENRFVNSATDRIGFNSFLPFDCDTSTPIHIVWGVRTDDNSAGNIKWTIRCAWVNEGGDVYASAAAAPTTAVNQVTVDATAAAPTASNTLKYYEARFSVKDLVSRVSTGVGVGDMLFVSLERAGGAGSDTHGGDVDLVQITAHYTRWSEGGHF